MGNRSTEAMLDRIRKLHEEWLTGTLASGDAVFLIGDVIEAHDVATGTEVKSLPITAHQ